MRKLIHCLCAFVFVLLIAITINIVLSVKITLVTSNVNSVRIILLDADKSVYTRDEKEVAQILKSINSFTYYKSNDTIIGSSSPDAWITTYDDVGNEIESIYFYGNVAVHHQNGKYLVGLFTYSKLKGLCRTFGE